MARFTTRCHFLFVARLFGAAMVAICCLASAQAQNAAPPKPVSLNDALRRAPYEEDETGPLLAISRPNEFTTKDAQILRHVVDAFDRKFINAGAITVIAPRRMILIAAEPGRAKIFANLPSDQRMKLLLASLTPAQWRIAGSTGIALGDLNPDQREIFATFLPPRLAVQKTELKEIPDKPNAYTRERVGDLQPVDLAQLRLTVGRRTFYEFSQVGKEDSKAMSGASDTRKQTAVYTPVLLDDQNRPTYGGSLERPQGVDRGNVFGVPILQSVPSAVKRGDLDFAAPSLNVGVALSEGWKTTGDAINALRKATGLEIYADRRVRDLILTVRTPAGQSVRAGDLLNALSLAVTGTYRRLDDGSRPVFVLTDDVQGIGTRFARLSEWAEAADSERYNRVDKAVEEAAQANPLPFLGFFPGDTLALPADINQRMEAAWAKEWTRMGVEVKTNDLPPDLQRDVEKQAKFWNEDANPPIPVHTDKVVVGAKVAFLWRLPDGSELEDWEAENGYNIGEQFLGRLAPRAPKTGGTDAPPPAATPAPSKTVRPALPADLKRRALIIAPSTPDEATQLVESGAARGIREFWVMKTLDAGDDAPLKAVIAAAKARRLPVYLCISAVRFAKIGVAERNVLGQTGDEWFQAQKNSSRYKAHPEWWSGSVWQYERWLHWVYPTGTDLTAMEKRLVALASLPGIAGVAFKNVAAPGYGGEFRGGDGIYSNGYFGYTLPMRLAFLRQKSIDPIDLVEGYGLRDLSHSLPFFPEEASGRFTLGADGKGMEVPSASGDWRDFRYERAAGWAKRFHKALQDAKPNLPIYISDRASDYATPYAEWFGLWEDADALPQNPVFAPEGEGRVTARRYHKVVLKRGGWDKSGGASQEPQWFAGSIVEKGKEAAKAYDGLAIDLSQLSGKDALHLLNGLAALSPRTAGNR